MSADNFIIVVPHTCGGYKTGMGFASDETPVVIRKDSPTYDTISDALESVKDEYVEYGVSTLPSSSEYLFEEGPIGEIEDLIKQDITYREFKVNLQAIINKYMAYSWVQGLFSIDDDDISEFGQIMYEFDRNPYKVG